MKVTLLRTLLQAVNEQALPQPYLFMHGAHTETIMVAHHVCVCVCVCVCVGANVCDSAGTITTCVCVRRAIVCLPWVSNLRVQWKGQQEEAVKQQAAEEAKAKAEAEAKRMQKEAAKQQSAAEAKRKKEEKRKREEPLDLLRSIHEEVHLQNTLEASGYRSPTWQILRATILLQS